MKLLKPRTSAGEACLYLASTALLIVLVQAALFLIVRVSGCEVDEAGTGACMLAGVNVMPTLAKLFLSSIVVTVVAGPVCFLGAVCSGLWCLWRRRW